MEFERGGSGTPLGYKTSGANAMDGFGNLDTAKVTNVAQEGTLAWPETVVPEPTAELSEMATEAVQKLGGARSKTGGATAGGWFARRIKNQRIKNQKR